MADANRNGNVDAGEANNFEPQQFLRLSLGSDAGIRNQVQDLRNSPDDYTDSLDQNGVPVKGLYNGLVFSFVTKSATGYSTRVYEHIAALGENHEFIIPFLELGNLVVQAAQLRIWLDPK